MVQVIGSSTYDHIRRQDVEAFRDAARRFKVHILVRRTNPASLQYIGRQGYIPKPVDCKPKTADRDVVLPSGRIVRCEGLVVNPTIPGFAKAFATTRKLGAALRAWSVFEARHGTSPGAIARGAAYFDGFSLEKAGGSYAFSLHRGGVFLVNSFPDDAHFGCLMFCPFQIEAPVVEGDWSALQELMFRKTNSYLHGDYDLYGLVPADMPEFKTVERSIRFGVENLYTERFGEIRDFLNRRFGSSMIQHGAQENVDHIEDHLDVFWPNGEATEVQGQAAIEKLYAVGFRGRAAGPQSTPLVRG